MKNIKTILMGIGLVGCVPLFALASTPYDTLETAFNTGKLPSDGQMTGLFEGRCYSQETPSQPKVAYLGGAKVIGDHGPMFPDRRETFFLMLPSGSGSRALSTASEKYQKLLKNSQGVPYAKEQGTNYEWDQKEFKYEVTAVTDYLVLRQSLLNQDGITVPLPPAPPSSPGPEAIPTTGPCGPAGCWNHDDSTRPAPPVVDPDSLNRGESSYCYFYKKVK